LADEACSPKDNGIDSDEKSEMTLSITRGIRRTHISWEFYADIPKRCAGIIHNETTNGLRLTEHWQDNGGER